MVKKCFLLIIFLITFGVGLLSLESYALNDDPALKLYFTFDEGQGDTAKDHSQSKLKGKLTGNAKFTKEGKFGGALSLEDKDCLVQVPASDELDITKSITMAAWIFPLEDQNDSNVMGRRTAANKGGYCLQWSGFGAAAKIETWIALPDWKGTRKLQKIEPELKQWHHVVVTYDGKKIKQYIDSKLDASLDAAAGKITSQKVELHIGQAQTGLPSMIGKIDEVAIYDRALTLDEIKSDMENGVFFAVDPKEKLATKWANLKK